MNIASQIDDLVTKVRALQPRFDDASATYRKDTPQLQSAKFDPSFWCTNAYGNGLIRIRQFIEQNFVYVETMGLLAVTRYIIELSIWLNLFRVDRRYGLVYYRVLLDTQHRFFVATERHILREIALLKDLDVTDSQAVEAMIQEYKVSPEKQGDPQEMMRRAEKVADEKAARKFSIYADQAKTHGYGFQAHLVETKALPDVRQRIDALNSEIDLFDRTVPAEIRDLVPKKWNWREMAKKVGMDAEYDYVYSYVSKLLHATPASLTTDQKNLEVDEIYILLRYIHVKMLDILDLTR